MERDGKGGKKKGRGLFKNESINLWLCDFDREASKDETNIPPRCLFCDAEREHSRRRAQRRSANTDLTPSHSSLPLKQVVEGEPVALLSSGSMEAARGPGSRCQLFTPVFKQHVKHR